MSISRRKFIELAASFGASLAFRSTLVHASNIEWREQREFYPQGVASGDPDPDSVILWTRRPPIRNSEASRVTLEVAEDADFRRVIATSTTTLSPDTDWTTRVLAAGLQSRRVYWYRFTDDHGFGSRVGRTITAPTANDNRPISFTFVSCQNMQMGGANAYRRMIWEDEQKSANDQLSFVLHLGDFVYEVVWYPEDRPQGYYARRLRDVVRYPHGEKIRDFHVPTTVDDYRALYRGYLLDPDLQDARARWPFVCMWDNHEFSWKGWQSQQDFSGVRPAQTRKVAANQAWFEYQPSRVVKSNPGIDRYLPPVVSDAPLRKFDDHGLGLEPGNLSAINSLKLYRTLRFGRNVELILTDNRSYRSEPVMHRAEAAPFQPQNFPYVLSENVVDVLDGGRDFNHGKPPDEISFNGKSIPNPRKHESPQSMLGVAQKAWFLEKLRASSVPWKLWGNSVAMADWRLDFQHLPKNIAVKWPDAGFATFMDDDWSAYRHERAEVLDFIRSKQITGVVALCGDRHAFEAAVVSESLPPKPYYPLMAEFVTGSISAPGLFEAAEYSLPKDHPLRAVYVYQPSANATPQPAINYSIACGVNASLALTRTGEKAPAEEDWDVGPHLPFIDLGGHGYSVVHAGGDELEVEFVCIVRPLERSERADGGPLAYRVAHSVKQWTRDATPRIKRTRVEGTLPLGR